MGKMTRIISSTGFYHVYNRGIDKTAIFNLPQQRYFLMKCVRECLCSCKVQLYAFCIMNNHLHFLIRGDLKEISRFMQFVEGHYGTIYNDCNKRQGRVFQNAFKSKPVEDELYLWGLIRYIHMNPVKAGLCKTPDRYRYGSLYDFLHYPSEQSLLSEEVISFIRQYYKEPQELIDFHYMEDVYIYDDIPEEMKTQETALLKSALSWINSNYAISNWTDAGNDLKYRDIIVRLLYHRYHMTLPKIADLLSMSRYQLQLALKE